MGPLRESSTLPVCQNMSSVEPCLVPFHRTEDEPAVACHLGYMQGPRARKLLLNNCRRRFTHFCGSSISYFGATYQSSNIPRIVNIELHRFKPSLRDERNTATVEGRRWRDENQHCASFPKQTRKLQACKPTSQPNSAFTVNTYRTPRSIFAEPLELAKGSCLCRLVFACAVLARLQHGGLERP